MAHWCIILSMIVFLRKPFRNVTRPLRDANLCAGIYMESNKYLGIKIEETIKEKCFGGRTTYFGNIYYFIHQWNLILELRLPSFLALFQCAVQRNFLASQSIRSSHVRKFLEKIPKSELQYSHFFTPKFRGRERARNKAENNSKKGYSYLSTYGTNFSFSLSFLH